MVFHYVTIQADVGVKKKGRHKRVLGDYSLENHYDMVQANVGVKKKGRHKRVLGGYQVMVK